MKLLVTIIAAICITTTSFSQEIYDNFKEKVRQDGWKFYNDKKMYLAQGATDYGIYKLEAGKRYKFFLMSDDQDVKDVDAWLYRYENGNQEELDKDTDNERMAIVSYTPSKTMHVKVVGKNVSSDDPGYKSRVFVLVTYSEF